MRRDNHPLGHRFIAPRSSELPHDEPVPSAINTVSSTPLGKPVMGRSSSRLIGGPNCFFRSLHPRSVRRNHPRCGGLRKDDNDPDHCRQSRDRRFSGGSGQRRRNHDSNNRIAPPTGGDCQYPLLVFTPISRWSSWATARAPERRSHHAQHAPHTGNPDIHECCTRTSRPTCGKATQETWDLSGQMRCT